jgi:ubiquinone/menaquinone biosynthesis C-methylase UbiE
VIKYDEIGKTYNLTRRADPFITERLAYLSEFRKEGLYLDIGCGSGNYTHELQQLGYNFIGIDPSGEMLEKAKLKNPAIDWRLGSAESLSLNKNSIDGVVATLTIHHWQDLGKGFAELARVLKPGGILVLFTSLPEQMQNYWLRRYFPIMIEASIVQMPSLEQISAAMKAADISIIQSENYFVKSDLQDLFLQSGKNDPELYFQPEVRAGISSFASLANTEEINEGLTRLRKDIDSGKIKQIISNYESDLGDYLFIKAIKN